MPHFLFTTLAYLDLLPPTSLRPCPTSSTLTSVGHRHIWRGCPQRPPNAIPPTLCQHCPPPCHCPGSPSSPSPPPPFAHLLRQQVEHNTRPLLRYVCTRVLNPNRPDQLGPGRTDTLYLARSNATEKSASMQQVGVASGDGLGRGVIARSGCKGEIDCCTWHALMQRRSRRPCSRWRVLWGGWW